MGFLGGVEGVDFFWEVKVLDWGGFGSGRVVPVLGKFLARQGQIGRVGPRLFVCGCGGRLQVAILGANFSCSNGDGFVFDKVTSVWSKPAARPAPLFMSQSRSQKRASKNEVVVVSGLDSLEEDDYLEEDVEAEHDEHN
mmetsp:Transcript_6445/g.8068  ORF Transcript_6445/g.8068 Transcript_6445/m.8068 type:complete len:139 (-) Transcript_6445:1428-1844(-)